jgi:hypothetical protein
MERRNVDYGTSKLTFENFTDPDTDLDSESGAQEMALRPQGVYQRKSATGAASSSTAHLVKQSLTETQQEQDEFRPDKVFDEPIPATQVALLRNIAKRLAPMRQMSDVQRRVQRLELVAASALMLFVILIIIAGASLKQADDFLQDMNDTGVAPLIGELVNTYHTVWKHEMNVTIAAATDMAGILYDFMVQLNLPHVQTTISELFTLMHNVTTKMNEQISNGEGIGVRIV